MLQVGSKNKGEIERQSGTFWIKAPPGGLNSKRACGLDEKEHGWCKPKRYTSHTNDLLLHTESLTLVTSLSIRKIPMNTYLLI